MQKQQKQFFFIGLTATGNQTAAKAMATLGYRVRHFPLSLEEVGRYEVLTDTPVGMWFRQGQLPLENAEIIMTIRSDLEGWLNACKVWFTEDSVPQCNRYIKDLRQFLYGSLVFEREAFLKSYETHLQECNRIAAEAGISIHYWDVLANPDWHQICQITLQPEPLTPFPFKLHSPLRWEERPLYQPSHFPQSAGKVAAFQPEIGPKS